MKHRIEITTNQAKVMRDALEMYARTLKGQHFGITDNLDMVWSSREEFSATFQKTFEPSDSMSKKSDIAWDLYQSVRHSVAWLENPKGGVQVCYDTPMRTSTEPLATVDYKPENPIEVLNAFMMEPLQTKVKGIMGDRTDIDMDTYNALLELGIGGFVKSEDTEDKIQYITELWAKIEDNVIDCLKAGGYDPNLESSHRETKVNNAIRDALKVFEPVVSKRVLIVLMLVTTNGGDKKTFFEELATERVKTFFTREN